MTDSARFFLCDEIVIDPVFRVQISINIHLTDIVEQVEKQLNKVIPVIKVKTLNPEELISRELSLIKVGCTSKQRPDLMKIAELMQANIVDVTPNSMTFQFADTGERTETLISLIKPYGIREIVRTGTVAIEKGAATVRKTTV